MVRGAVERLTSGSATALLLGGPALSTAGVAAADRIARATACQLLCESFPARLAYGRSRPKLARLPYFADAATELLRNVRDVLLVGCDAPVAFFGYPDGRSDLIPPNVRVHRVASAGDDAEEALRMLADELRTSSIVGANDEPVATVPAGRLTPASVCATIAAILPEEAIVIDEGMSAAGIHLQVEAASAPHSYMALTGGACGMALASAIGAAIDARVLTLVGDGSAMYTPQALWTQARESLNITNVIVANRGYRLLQVEYAQLEQERPDASARAMLELTRPEIEWVFVARALGLTASRVDSIESLAKALRIGVREPGPSLIEVVL